MKHGSQYLRDVAVLLAGNLGAQILGVGGTLVLARLYSTDQFGELAGFSAGVAALTIALTLRFDFAVPIARDSSEVASLSTFTSIWCTVIVSLMLAFCLALYGFGAVNSDRYEYWTALSIASAISAGNAMSVARLTYRRAFDKIARIRLYQAAMVLVASLAFSSQWDHGLIAGFLAGSIFVMIYLRYVDLPKRRTSLGRSLSSARKNYKFAFYSAPSDLLNSLSNTSLPVIILTSFGASHAGLFFMADRLLKMPLSLLAQSVSGVYAERAGKLYNERNFEKLIALTKFTQFRLGVLFGPFLLAASLFSPFAFKFVLGPTWEGAGLLVSQISVFSFFNGIYSPISQLGNILGYQRKLLLFNLSLGLTMVAPYFYLRDFDFSFVVLISSGLGAMHFLFLNIYIWIALLRHRRECEKAS